MIYISKNVDDKLDEYASFLRYNSSYTIAEAKTRRWEIEYQITQHCNPILMKSGSSGTIKFKSVLQRQEIERFVNNRSQDVQAFAQELEFYARRSNFATG